MFAGGVDTYFLIRSARVHLLVAVVTVPAILTVTAIVGRLVNAVDRVLAGLRGAFVDVNPAVVSCPTRGTGALVAVGLCSGRAACDVLALVPPTRWRCCIGN